MAARNFVFVATQICCP